MRLEVIKRYLSLIKFSHTIFAMPFALIGFFLAVRDPPVYQWNLNTAIGWGEFGVDWGAVAIKFFLVIFCMVFARSAAMAFNRWLDAKFDALNPRTAIREIPAGIISSSNALRFVLINCIAFWFCTWFINLLCFLLAPVALFIILFYSYTKRFTPLCHLVLGLGLSLAPIGAYLAVNGQFALLPVLFSFIVLFWVSGFDIIYALQDEEFDRSQNLHSIPAYFGKRKALLISEGLHVICIIFVIYAGLQGEFGFFYWLGTTVFAGMLYYQHSIVKPEDLSRVNLAFMTVNGIASIVFAILVIADIMIYSG